MAAARPNLSPHPLLQPAIIPTCFNDEPPVIFCILFVYITDIGEANMKHGTSKYMHISVNTMYAFLFIFYKNKGCLNGKPLKLII